MQIEEIYDGLFKLLSQFINKEFQDQGHYLTGNFSSSLSYRISKFAKSDTLAGYAVAYAKILEEGLTPDKISWKMYPGLTKYFILRGYGPEEAKRIAGATIKKWFQEGLSTQASKAYSKTGSRHHFIEAVFVGKEPQIDEYMINTIDFAFEEQSNKTKSETI